MAKYYRTYITTFENSEGINYYAGKHVSTYENPSDDPYYGSGTVVRRTVEKYGRSCILNQVWFDHETYEEMGLREVELISNVKLVYGDKCTNIAKGGDGGYTRQYLSDEEKSQIVDQWKLKFYSKTPEQMDEFRNKVGESSAEMWASMTDEQRADHSKKTSAGLSAMWERRSDEDIRLVGDRISAGHKRRTPEQKIDTGNKIKASKQNKTEEEAAIISENIKAAQRKSGVWSDPLYTMLWELWNELGRPKHGRFEGHCRRNDITDLAVRKLVKHFNERVYLESNQ